MNLFTNFTGLASGIHNISDNAPSSPDIGEMWLNPLDGKLSCGLLMVG